VYEAEDDAVLEVDSDADSLCEGDAEGEGEADVEADALSDTSGVRVSDPERLALGLSDASRDREAARDTEAGLVAAFACVGASKTRIFTSDSAYKVNKNNCK